MKKIIVILLGVALIIGVTVLLVNPNEAAKTETAQSKQVTTKPPAESSSSNRAENKKVVKDEVSTAKEAADKEEKLYTKAEMEAAVEKAEIEMAESIMRETVSPEEVTETANSVVKAYEGSRSTAKSDATQAAINNYIHENGVYDKLAEKGVIFSGVECRDAACKLQFEVSDTDDNLKRRMPKMFSITEELESLDLIKDMEAIITNDFEGRSLQYYYY